MKILVVGDITRDRFLTLSPSDVGLHCNLNSTECEICFQYAQKIPVQSVVEDIGGNAANVAVGAARLGADVSLAAQLGDDEPARLSLDYFEQEKVNTELVEKRAGERTNFSVVINYRGERTIFSYHNPRPYNMSLEGNYDTIYLTSLGQGYEYVYEKVLQLHKDKIIVFQPGTIQLKEGRGKLSRLLTCTNILLLNLTEARLLVGRDDEPKELMQYLLDLGVKEIVITCGKDGSYVSDGTNSFWVGVWKDAIRKEVTGVGDAFSTGYMIARDKLPLQEAAKFGSINAGSVMQYVGAQKGLLLKKDLNRLYRKAKDEIEVKEL